MMSAVATVAKVEKVDGGYIATLSCHQQSSCSGCASKSSCATGQMTKVIGNRTHLWTLSTSKPLAVGEQVEIGFPEAALVSSAAIVYLLPLLGLLLGALLGDKLFQAVFAGSETGAIIGGIGGLALTFIALKRYLANKTAREQQQVTLIRRLGGGIETQHVQS